MSEQIAVRLPDSLARSLDEVVSAGTFRSRAEAVRIAIEQFVDSERRRKIGLEIADAYRRIPQTDEEVEAASEAAIRSIHEEPW